MTRTLYVKRPEVWKLAKAKAASKDLSLSDVVETLLISWTNGGSPALDKLLQIQAILDS